MPRSQSSPPAVGGSTRGTAANSSLASPAPSVHCPPSELPGGTRGWLGSYLARQQMSYPRRAIFNVRGGLKPPQAKDVMSSVQSLVPSATIFLGHSQRCAAQSIDMALGNAVYFCTFGKRDEAPGGAFHFFCLSVGTAKQSD